MTLLQDARIIELASVGRYTNREIGELAGVSEATVRRAKQRAENTLTPVSHIQLEQPIVLTDWSGMVTADWHVPLYNPYLVNEMVERAVDLELKELIIGGDFFNFDSLSQYDPKQQSAGLELELAEANRLLVKLGDTFERIYIIWGNHDARLHKSLSYRVQFDLAMRAVLGEANNVLGERLCISNLDHMWLRFSDQPQGDWKICHPATYSRIPLATPRTLAAKHNANIICAHAHHAAIGFATDGQKVCVEIGGLFDQYKTSYLQRSTTFPEWTPGYGWFKNSRFFLTTPLWQST